MKVIWPTICAVVVNAVAWSIAVVHSSNLDQYSTRVDDDELQESNFNRAGSNKEEYVDDDDRQGASTADSSRTNAAVQR